MLDSSGADRGGMPGLAVCGMVSGRVLSSHNYYVSLCGGDDRVKDVLCREIRKDGAK